MNMDSVELSGDGGILIQAVIFYNGERFECVCPTISKEKRDYG